MNESEIKCLCLYSTFQLHLEKHKYEHSQSSYYEIQTLRRFYSMLLPVIGYTWYSNSVVLAVIGKHLVDKSLVGGSSMIRFPLVIADSKRDMPGIEPGHLPL